MAGKIAIGVISTVALVGGGVTAAFYVQKKVEKRKELLNRKIESAVIRFDAHTLEQVLAEGHEIEVEDVNARNSSGKTLLMLAGMGGHTELVKHLLEYTDIDPNLRDSQNGWTALHWAAVNGNQDTVDALIEFPDTNVNQPDSKNGESALMKAALMGHEGVVSSLVQHGDININHFSSDKTLNALLAASHSGSVRSVCHILNHPETDVNSTDREGWNALHRAASEGHPDIVEVLLINPVLDVNAQTNNGKHTALSLSAKRGHAHVVKKLLLNRPDVDVWANDENEKAAMDLALERGHDHLVPMFTNLHLQTELGQVLRAHKLDAYAKAFYENNIYTIDSASDISEEELIEDFSVESEVDRAAMQKLFRTSHHVFVSFIESELEMKEEEKNGIDIFMDLVRERTDKVDFMEASLDISNHESHESLIETIQRSDIFLAVLTPGYFSNAKTLEALTWAFTNDIPIVTCYVLGIENTVSPSDVVEYVQLGSDLLGEEDWEMMEEEGLSPFLVVRAVEALSKAKSCTFDFSLQPNSIWSTNTQDTQLKTIIGVLTGKLQH